VTVPAWQNATTNTATGATALTLTAPSGIQDNDLLIVFMWWGNDPGTVTLPSGFTQVTTVTQGTNIQRAYFKRASGESGNYAFSWVNSRGVIAEIHRVSGGSLGTNVIAMSATGGGSATDPVAPSVTTPADDCLLLACVTQLTTLASTSTAPAGWTETTDHQGATASTVFQTSARKSQASQGSSGTATFDSTQLTAQAYTAITLAVAPVIAGAPYVASASTDKTGSTSSEPTVTFASNGPAGIAAGDLLLAFAHVALETDTLDTPLLVPSGWTEGARALNSAGSHRGAIIVYYRVADGTETSVQFTVTPNGATHGMTVKVLRIVAPFAGATWSVNAQGTSAVVDQTPDIAGVVTTYANTLLLYSAASATGSAQTWTPPADLFEEADFSTDPGEASSLTIATMVKATAGASGTKTFTNTAASPDVLGMTFAVAAIEVKSGSSSISHSSSTTAPGSKAGAGTGSASSSSSLSESGKKSGVATTTITHAHTSTATETTARGAQASLSPNADLVISGQRTATGIASIGPASVTTSSGLSAEAGQVVLAQGSVLAASALKGSLSATALSLVTGVVEAAQADRQGTPIGAVLIGVTAEGEKSAPHVPSPTKATLITSSRTGVIVAPSRTQVEIT
jgi:hypothetical protein